MVHFTQCRSASLYIQLLQWCINAPDYSIRKSGGKWICAPDPGLSQLITSFFAWQLPGIRHRPVFAWPYHLFRSFTKTGIFVCVRFLTKQYTIPRSKASSIFNIRLKIFPYVFRPSFVISKNNSDMSFDIPEKEITELKCILYTKY